MPLSAPATAIDFSAFAPVVTPAPTDEFVVRQADGVSRLETRLQIHTLEVGEQFFAPIDNDPLTPSIAISGTGSGLYGSALDIIRLSIAGVDNWIWTAGALQGTFGGAPLMVPTSGLSSTVPVYAYRGDVNTGHASPALDEMVAIAGAVEVARFTEAAGIVQFIVRSQNNIATPAFALGDGDTGILETADDVAVLASLSQNCMEFSGIGSVPLIAFYGTAAIALQTGVAVTAAGIHAALVNLGLITA